MSSLITRALLIGFALTVPLSALVYADPPGAESSPSAGAHDRWASALTPDERKLVAEVPYSGSPIRNRSGKFDTKFSIPAGVSWEALFQKPRIISMFIEPVPDGNGKQVTVGDVEGVFPVEPRYYFRALINYASYPRVSPRTVYDAERSTVSGPFAYHKRIQKISAQFLGFGETYLFVTNNYETRLGSDSYGVKWNLEQSLDGKIYSLMGSWYVAPVQCDGAICTYARYFNRTGLVQHPSVPVAILRLVTTASFRNLLIEFYDEAVRLRNAESGTS